MPPGSPDGHEQPSMPPCVHTMSDLPGTVRNGDRGPDVARLQRLLSSLGWIGLAVDGHFGPLTESAVRGYQAKAGLIVDGIAGPATWRMLLAEPGYTTFAPTVEEWRALVDEMRGDLDLTFLLSWISHESGGNPCSTGIVHGDFCVEAGIGQLYFESPASVQFGTTSGRLRAACRGTSAKRVRELTDDERREQVRSTVDMARAYRSKALKVLAVNGLAWGRRDGYRLTKLVHALPAVVTAFVPALRPVDWASFRRRVEGMSRDQLAAIHRAVARYHGDPLRRVFANAHATGGDLDPDPKDPLADDDDTDPERKDVA